MHAFLEFTYCQFISFFLFFVRITIFYSEHNQYVYNFYGTDLYESACRLWANFAKML